MRNYFIKATTGFSRRSASCRRQRQMLPGSHLSALSALGGSLLPCSNPV